MNLLSEDHLYIMKNLTKIVFPFSVPTCPTSITDGTFLKPCSFLRGASCEFRCIPGKGRTSLQSLTCGQNLQWDADLESLCAGELN